MHLLRNRDRETHVDDYPSLTFPELYLLEGGYKAFFDAHPFLCQPSSYTPMSHDDHLDDLRHFRKKSKTWAGEQCVTRAGATGSLGGLSVRSMSRRNRPTWWVVGGVCCVWAESRKCWAESFRSRLRHFKDMQHQTPRDRPYETRRLINDAEEVQYRWKKFYTLGEDISLGWLNVLYIYSCCVCVYIIMTSFY